MTEILPEVARFDLFICHVSKADGKLARNIKRGLEQLAAASKPPQLLRIFVDHDNVAAGSDLPTNIRRDLDRSNHLLILVRPELEQREWCRLEIAHWLDSRPNDPPLLAHSGGSNLRYTDARLSFESAEEKPPEALAGAYRTEPSWVDLRPAHVGDDWWIHLAKIASPLLSRAPQELFHAHAAEIRRKLWRTRMLLAAAIVFALGAISGLWYYIHAQSIELERLALLDLQSGTTLVARANFSEGLPSIEAAATRERQTRRARIYQQNVLRSMDSWQTTTRIGLPGLTIMTFRVGNTPERLLVTDAQRRAYRSTSPGELELLKGNIVAGSLSPNREHMLLETEQDLSWCGWSGPCVPIPATEFGHAAIADRQVLVVNPTGLVVFDLPGMAPRGCAAPDDSGPIDRIAPIDGDSFLVASGDNAWRLTGSDCVATAIEGGWAHIESASGPSGKRIVVATDPGGLEEPTRVAVETDCGLELREESVSYRDSALHASCAALAVTLDDSIVVVRPGSDGDFDPSVTLAEPFAQAAEVQFIGDTLMLTSADHVQFVREDLAGEQWLPIRSESRIDSAWAVDDSRVYVLTADGALRMWTRRPAEMPEETGTLPDTFLDAESGMVGNRHRARVSGYGDWLVKLPSGTQKGPFVHDTEEDLDRVCESSGFTLCPLPDASVDTQGKYLLTAAGQEPVRLWRTADGTFRSLKFDMEYIRSVQLSDSGDASLARGSSYYGSEYETVSIFRDAAYQHFGLRHRERLAGATSDLRHGLTIRQGDAFWVTFGPELKRQAIAVPFDASCGGVLSPDLFYVASVEDEVMLFDAGSRTPLTTVLAAANPDGEMCPTVKWEPSRIHNDGHALGRVAVQASGDGTWRIFEFERNLGAPP